MSTTFGISISGKDFELDDDCLPPNTEEWIEIAHRGNGGHIVWMNEVAKFLPLDKKVYPLDNSAQGIYTIEDIIKITNP